MAKSKSSTTASPPQIDQLARELHTVVHNLAAAYSTCVTVTYALKQQNADDDRDFAKSLSFGVSRCLALQIETLQKMVQGLGHPMPEELP